MWGSGSFRLLAAASICALALTSAPGAASAGGKKGKRSAATVGAKLSDRALGELMGPYKFGMGKQDVLRILSRQIGDRYKEKIAGTTDVYMQDKLRRDRQAELDRIKASYSEFHGEKTGWDVSIIDDQFAHNTGEAMMVYWENAPDTGRDQRRFFFFHDGKLYKMFIALNSSQLKDEQRNFGYFKSLMEQRYGAGRVNAEKGMIEWRSATYQVAAIDKINFYGSFCLVIADPQEEKLLADLRASRKKPPEDNKVIQSVMQDDKNPETPGLDDNRAGVEGVIGTRKDKN